MISKGKPVMVGDEYYDVRCLSTDVKPTKQIKNGSLLIEIDTGKRYLFDYEQKAWNEVPFDSGAAPATTSTAGIVKPDGKTIDVSQDGTISIATEGDGAIRSVTAEGWATQARTTGKNLLRNTVTTTNNGITFTVNADGTVTVSGTATAQAVFYSKPISDLSNGYAYTLSGCPSGGSNTTYFSTTFNSSYAGQGTNDYGSGVTFTKGDNHVRVGIIIRSGVTCNNLVFRPQLELGSTATEYEPYTGGAPSPSPDYPQEIQVARGRNLWEWNTISGYTLDWYNHYELENEQKRVLLKAGHSHVLSSADKNFSWRPAIRAWDTDGNIIGANSGVTISVSNSSISYYSTNHSFLTESEKTNPIIVITVTVDTWVNCINRVNNTEVPMPQLTLGSTPTPYVPYGHVGLEVTHGGTTTTIPIPLPSKGFAASLPDGTHDTLTIDGAGHVEWESAVGRIESYAGESVGSVYLSTTGDLTTGAEVLYPLATPTTEDMGYVTLPITTEGDTVSIPELEDVAVVRWADAVATEVAQAWYRRAYAELGNAITDLAARVAALES